MPMRLSASHARSLALSYKLDGWVGRWSLTMTVLRNCATKRGIAACAEALQVSVCAVQELAASVSNVFE